jgi:hypothetical protein
MPNQGITVSPKQGERTMEGNYHFVWKAIAIDGAIEGVYEQTIYGENLAAAIEQFTTFYGNLSPDENGVCLVITCIAWQAL